MNKFHALVLLILPVAAGAQTNHADDEALMRKNAIAVCASLQPRFDAMKSWYRANKGKKPDTPVPPVIDPDCVQCKDGAHADRNQGIVDKFNEQAMQPEADMIKGVLAIAREKQLRNEGGNVLPYDNAPNEGRFPCLDKMPDYDLRNILELAEHRLSQKETGILDQYGRRSEYFLGGCRIVLGILRQLALLGYGSGNIPPQFSAWAMTYYNKAQDKLFKEYKYDIYPTLVYLPRQMELLGNSLSHNTLKMDQGNYTIEPVDEGADLIKKAYAFMHFRIRIKIEANGHAEDGSQLRAVISGETTVHCDLGHVGDVSCYNWKGSPDSAIKFKVEDLVFHNENGAMEYQGPKEFSNPYSLSIALCDASPQFQLSLSDIGPSEEFYKVPVQEGGSKIISQSGIISSLFAGIMADAATDRFRNMESQQSELEALARRGEQHPPNDPYWKTPQGRKDIQLMQNAKKQMGVGDNESGGSMLSQISKIVAPFKSGQKKAVDYTAKAKLLTQHGEGSGWDYATITVTMEQQ